MPKSAFEEHDLSHEISWVPHVEEAGSGRRRAGGIIARELK